MLPKKILIIKPSSLGDVVHSLPFLNAINETFPYARIHWVIAKGLEGLFENHPMVNKLWIINKDRWKDVKKLKETISEIRQLFRSFKSESYDLAIDLQGLFRSGILAYASKAPFRVGFKEAREGSVLFYTHKIEVEREIHAVDRYLKIASAIGCEFTDVKFPMPFAKGSEKVKRLKEEIKDYAVIVPGARWKTKRWSHLNFGRLASMLDIKTLIVGSSGDAGLAESIEVNSKGKALSLAGKTDINELISIIRGARFVITNDSGPMHIAAALNIPVVAIFGPTNPVRTGPYGKNHVVIKSDIKCAPCYKKSCDDVKCMESISVEMVFNKICEICL